LSGPGFRDPISCGDIGKYLLICTPKWKIFLKFHFNYIASQTRTLRPRHAQHCVPTTPSLIVPATAMLRPRHAQLSVPTTPSLSVPATTPTCVPETHNSAFQQRHLHTSQRRQFNSKSNNNWKHGNHVFDTTTRSIDRPGSPLNANTRSRTPPPPRALCQRSSCSCLPCFQLLLDLLLNRRRWDV
jgi:hypothetical protein